jgi:hypothetical protein
LSRSPFCASRRFPPFSEHSLQALLSDVDIRLPRPLRLLLKGVKDVDTLGKLRDIEHAMLEISM